MSCPFCFSELKHLEIVDDRFGPKVEFECVNSECEEGKEKVFFSYLDTGKLEW